MYWKWAPAGKPGQKKYPRFCYLGFTRRHCLILARFLTEKTAALRIIKKPTKRGSACSAVNLIIKAELKAALSLAQELRAVAEGAERRSRLANERAEALAAMLTEVRSQLQLSNDRVTRAEITATEAVGTQLQAERRVGELDARLVEANHELTQARQSETALHTKVIDLEQKLAARDGNLNRLNSEILDARGHIDILRSGEAELKEALAQHQVGERELRQRLAAEMERVARGEERLTQMTAAMGRLAPKSKAERELE